MVAAAIFLNDEDIADIKEMTALVDEVEVRMVPSEPRTDIRKILK